ncbi:hypothetical protein HOC37_05445 [bacterium]|nr:hypothetical protein [bacterium]MBT3580840.1 hypothetical protein [bacterium]MBT4552406.1 hypothetical protein [bacterium]MBT5989076.1 hypothetical protein [bacterium]
MKKMKLAKRYMAAFQATLADKDHQAALAEFIAITNLFLEKKIILNFLKSPLVDIEKKISFMKKVCVNLKYTDKIKKLLILLLRKKRQEIFLELKIIAEKEIEKLQNLWPAKIVLSEDCTENIKKNIVKKLEEKENKKIKPMFIINPVILGGFKAYIENKVYDASIKTVLNKIKAKL